MRRDKTVARILLIFSIANVVLAAPAFVRQRHLVTDRGDDEPTDESNTDAQSNGPVRQNSVSYSYSSASLSGSEPGSGLDSLGGYSDNEDPSPNSWPSLHQDSVPRPPSGSLNQDLVPVSGGTESRDDLSPVSGGSRLQPVPNPSWLQTNERPPSQWEVGESSHTKEESSHTAPEVLPPAPEAQPLHDEETPWWHDQQLHTDGIDHDPDYVSTFWTKWRGFGSEAHANTPMSTVPQLGDVDHIPDYPLANWRSWDSLFRQPDDDTPSMLGSQHSDDPPPRPETPELHDIPPATPGSPLSQDDSTSSSEAAQLHNDPPSGSGDQPLHDDMHSSWQNWLPVTEIEQEADDKKLKGLCDLFKCW